MVALPSVPGGQGRQNSIGPRLIVLRNLFETDTKKTSNPDRETTLSYKMDVQWCLGGTC